MKKNIFFILFIHSLVYSQTNTAFQNNGSIQIHSNAEVGFHTNLVNNGTFDNNLGEVGFYSDNEVRTVSGSNSPVFYDLIIGAANNVNLEISMGVTNVLSFLEGKVITPRDDKTISLSFINHDFYIGQDNQHHVDGYISFIGNNEFTFPIGDDNRLREMKLQSENTNVSFKGAYFYEDPESPTTFANQFLTTQKQLFIENISNQEFWDLDGNSATKVTLTWDTFSNINSLSNNLSLLRVVGWNEAQNEWVNLGNTEFSGDVESGEITSDFFIPDNYSIITIGSIFNNEIGNDNYLISPNNDNINDALVFDNLDQFEKNKLIIFNRWGNIVYEVENYKNNWKGISNGRSTLDSQSKLPVGTYFYNLRLGNNNQYLIEKKGWVYINR
jgi:gliding motility-associated-like protein